MAEQEFDYGQYTPQAGGRLFSSAMFGFNKEEVLEYLEEMADENYQRQEADERRMQEMTQRIQVLEANGSLFSEGGPQTEALEAQLETQRQQLDAALQELETLRNAPLPEGDDAQLTAQLQEMNSQLAAAQQENAWLREEFGKYELAYNQLNQQLVEMQNGRWEALPPDAAQMQSQLAQTQQQLEQMQQELAAQQEYAVSLQQDLENQQQYATTLQQDLANQQQYAATLQQELATQQQYIESLPQQVQDGTATSAQLTASSILDEAYAEANRIRDDAVAEKDRLRRQIQNSANGLAESIYSLRTELSDVESNVSGVLESVQLTLTDVMNALSHTEQNLATFGVQVDRFPSTAPAVQQRAVQPQQPQQQVVYFQPEVSSPLRRVTSEANQRNNARPFRPTYSNSPTAASGWPQTAEAYMPEDEATREARLHTLSESLVETLRQMME